MSTTLTSSSRPTGSLTPYPAETASDQELLAGLGQGDRRASSAFVRRFERRVYGLARAVVGDTNQAEDIAQEALSRAWRHARTYDPRRGSVTTWMLSITRNLAVDALRRRTPTPIDPQALVFVDQAGQEPPPEEPACIGEDAEVVRTALSQIPEEQRRAVVLAAVHGRTAKEIGAREGIPLGTAKTRIRSGLIKLRVLLSQDGAAQRREAPSGLAAHSLVGDAGDSQREGLGLPRSVQRTR